MSSGATPGEAREQGFPHPVIPKSVDHLPITPTPQLRRALSQEVIRRQSERGRESLREFIKLCWHVREPETPHRTNWHSDAMAEYLQAVAEGHIQNLLINVPPRHTKSLSACVFFPSWEWIKRPGMRYLFSSFSGDNTVRDALYARQLIRSEFYQERWGYAFRLSRDVNRQHRIENTLGGFRIAHGTGGRITGEGGQRIIVDDPHALDDDMSPARLRAISEWWDGVMASRVNDPESAARIVVQQRIHDKDLTGHIEEMMKQGGRRYEKLVLPAEYEPRFHAHFSVHSRKSADLWHPKVEVENLPNHYRDKIGKTFCKPGELVELEGDPRETDKELLWPQHMPRHELEALKMELGRKATGQLQQRPVPTEGDLFKERFFRYWTFTDASRIYVTLHLDAEDRIVPFEGLVFVTADLATSLSQTADETAISTWIWLTSVNKLLWLACDHQKYEGPDVVPAIRRAVSRSDASFAGIEKAGFQLSIVQQARRTGMPVIALVPDKDKRNRAIPAAVMMDGEQILLPKEDSPAYGRPFTGEAEAQLLKFTGSPNDDDDIVDTVSYASWVVLKHLQLGEKRGKRSWGTTPQPQPENGARGNGSAIVRTGASPAKPEDGHARSGRMVS